MQMVRFVFRPAAAEPKLSLSEISDLHLPEIKGTAIKSSENLKYFGTVVTGQNCIREDIKK
jgi:hypothetical protein